jgi:chromosome partitioning protein
MEGTCAIQNAIVNVLPNLDILPARNDLDALHSGIPNASSNRQNEIVKTKLRGIDHNYDFVIMDTAPSSLASLLTSNSLAAADYVIIPTQPELLPVSGIAQCYAIIDQARVRYINPDIQTLGVLIVRYEKNKNSRTYMEKFADYSDDIHLFKSIVRKNVKLSECINHGLPINFYNRSCHGFDDYRAVVAEIIARIRRVA